MTPDLWWSSLQMCMHHCYDISKPSNAYHIRGISQHWFKQWLVARQQQTITLINADISKNKPQWNFNQNTFLSFNEMHLKIWCAKWQPFCWGSVGPFWLSAVSLQWRHNERDGITNHQPHDCLLNHLFRHRSKKTSKLRVGHLPLCGEFTGTGEFPAQRASNVENVSIWWLHHVAQKSCLGMKHVSLENVGLCAKSMYKWLHPTEYWQCNYLSMP